MIQKTSFNKINSYGRRGLAFVYHVRAGTLTMLEVKDAMMPFKRTSQQTPSFSLNFV